MAKRKTQTERLREVFTFENFKAWVATKDPNETFRYISNCECASAQFAKAHGFPNARAGGHYVRTGDGRGNDPYNEKHHVHYPNEIADAYDRFRQNGGNTFGELLFELNAK